MNISLILEKNTYDIKKKRTNNFFLERQKGFITLKGPNLKKKGPNFRCITSDAKLVALFLQLASDLLKRIAMRCFISSLRLLRIAIVFLQTS